jgi:hypothetical protein
VTATQSSNVTEPSSEPSATRSTMRSGQRIDQLAVLEEERRFLLRSLRDLEREREAGDVDDVDYEALKDGYTVRAAAVLRQIDEGRQQFAPKKPAQWARRVLLSVAIIAASIGIGFVLAGAWGEREPGQNVSGATPGQLSGERDIDVTRGKLAEARAAMTSGDFATANGLFVEVDRSELERGSENAEARTYVGWTTALRARAEPESEATAQSYDIALLALKQAIAMDETYADPHCFVAIIEFNFRGDANAALPYVEQCQSLDPPADVKVIVESFADEIRAAAES